MTKIVAIISAVVVSLAFIGGCTATVIAPRIQRTVKACVSQGYEWKNFSCVKPTNNGGGA